MTAFWIAFAIIVTIYCFLGWRLIRSMDECAPEPQTDESVLIAYGREVAEREKVA